MARNIIKIARGTTAQITNKLSTLDEYEIIFNTTTDQLAVIRDGAAKYMATADHKHSAADITSGTLTVARGGTGAGTLTANRVLLGNGTSAISAMSSAGTLGQVLTSNGASAPTWQTLTITDTKNTAGSSNNTAALLYIVGATSQESAGATTYSNVNVYISGNKLYSNGTEVSVSGHSHSIFDINVSGGASGDIFYNDGSGKVKARSGTYYLTPSLADSTYLGIGATAADSSMLGGESPVYYAKAVHSHAGLEGSYMAGGQSRPMSFILSDEGDFSLVATDGPTVNYVPFIPKSSISDGKALIFDGTKGGIKTVDLTEITIDGGAIT